MGLDLEAPPIVDYALNPGMKPPYLAHGGLHRALLRNHELSPKIPTVRELRIFGDALTPAELHDVFLERGDALRFPAVQSLSLSGDSVTTVPPQVLAQLKELWLSGGAFTNENVTAILAGAPGLGDFSICDSPGISSFDLPQGNHLTKLGIGGVRDGSAVTNDTLTAILANAPMLQELTLEGSKITAFTVPPGSHLASFTPGVPMANDALASVLSQTPELASLLLSTAPNVTALALPKGSKLTTLEAGTCHGVSGLKDGALTSAVATAPELQSLTFMASQIQGGFSLPPGSKVTFLSIGADVPDGDDYTCGNLTNEKLAAILAKAPHIEVLGMPCPGITKIILPGGRKLKHLWAEGSGVSAADQKAVQLPQ